MTLLVLSRDGQTIEQLHLQSGQDYIIGRSAECDLVLSSAKGVSRNHLHIYESDQGWAIELTSKFGSALINGEDMNASEALVLNDGDVIRISEFELKVTIRLEAEIKPQQKSTSHEPVKSDILPNQGQKQPEAEYEATSPGTVVTGQGLSPYLKISEGEVPIEVLKLEGNYWVFGRDESCEICVPNQKISRKHFELSHDGTRYFIKDLNSSNGTKVNGVAVSASERLPIISGDVIEIMNIVIEFEIRDVAFQNKLQVLPEPKPLDKALMHTLGQTALATQELNHSVDGGVFYPPPDQFDQWGQGVPGVILTDTMGRLGNQKDIKKWALRGTIGALLAVALIFIVLDDKKPTQLEGKEEASSSLPGYEDLSSEQKASIEDSLNLARSLYHNGKYVLCLKEVEKIHALVPFFNNSKEMQTICQQGLNLARQSKEKQRQEKVSRETEEKIAIYVEKCRKAVGENPNLEEVEKCLQPANELNPEHPDIMELMTFVRVKQEENEARARARAAHLAQVQKGKNAYEQAAMLAKKHQLLQAIDAYQNFIGSSYPDPNNLKDQARREISSIKKKLSDLVSEGFEKCKSEYQNKAYKSAIHACDQALTHDPSRTDVSQLRRDILSDLREEMKVIYEDSILEESLGNVDAAKEKWKEIMKRDIKEDEYFHKAESKLKKYGIGI